MLNTKHRHKLIEGLVIAMGKPKAGSVDKEGEGGGYGEDEPDEGSPREEAYDDKEAMDCARDAGRALGVDLDDDQARSFVEAIRKIAG